jgi:hypothetical protein
MLAAACLNVSRAWDVWDYHLPFAARIAGIVPQSEFAFHAENEARFAGFPLLAERLQGWLWRLTGRPESANLLAFISVPALAAFLRVRFDVPIHLAILGLLAIPLVQLHATSCYVDLPANVAVAILVLTTMDAFATANAPSPRSVLAAAGAAAFAANTKVLMQPIVVVALAAFGIRCAWTERATNSVRKTLAIAGSLPIVFATPLKNLLAHDNPYYPLRLSVLGHVFEGPAEPYSSSPPWLAHALQPTRFAASVLEVGLRPMMDSGRWSLDQWALPTARDYRMGGFFGAYVLAQLVTLGFLLYRERSRRSVVAASGFAILTVLTASMVQSHELRYYMCWMLVLVSINLWMLTTLGTKARLSAGLLASAALGVVLVVTRAAYVYPSGVGFAELVRERTDDQELATVRDDETICAADEPFNFLWVARFHPPHRYVLREAEPPDGCDGLRLVR